MQNTRLAILVVLSAIAITILSLTLVPFFLIKDAGIKNESDKPVPKHFTINITDAVPITENHE